MFLLNVLDLSLISRNKNEVNCQINYLRENTILEGKTDRKTDWLEFFYENVNQVKLHDMYFFCIKYLVLKKINKNIFDII